MVIIPPFFPRRKKKPSPEQTTPRTVNVISVALIDNTGALWTFDGPVTINENTASPQMRIQTSSGWQGASNIGYTDIPNQIACDYESGDLESGQSWLVEELPENVSFEGATFPLPQSGIVE